MLHAAYRDNLRLAKVFEDFVYHQLLLEGVCIVRFDSQEYQCAVGENAGGVEVKIDRKFRETGNLFIETEEKSHAACDWKLSGILRPDNSWLYAIGDFDGFYILSITLMRIMHRMAGANEGFKFRRVETATARGFLFPVTEAKRFADKIVVPKPGTVPDLGLPDRPVTTGNGGTGLF